jgi:hypothetical protein
MPAAATAIERDGIHRSEGIPTAAGGERDSVRDSITFTLLLDADEPDH